MASKYFYYRWGEALINRSLGASELPNLCMKWLFLAPTTPKGKYNVLVGQLNFQNILNLIVKNAWNFRKTLIKWQEDIITRSHNFVRTRDTRLKHVKQSR